MDAKKLLQISKEGVCFSLSIAEATMTKRQFRNFKKLLLDHYHQVLEPNLRVEIKSVGVNINEEGE